MQENASLTAKQVQLIAALVAGSTIVDAAKACKVDESTAHRWLKLPAVAAALEEARTEVFQETLHVLRLGTRQALAALLKHLKADVEPTAATQVAAGRFWIEQAITLYGQSEAAHQLASNGGIMIYLPNKETGHDSSEE